MKCPNHQLVNLPLKAVYCPLCGQMLDAEYTTPNPLFTQNFLNKKNERTNLYFERRSFLQFRYERKQLYELLSTFDDYQQSKEKESKKKKTKIIIWIVLVVFFTLITCGVFLIFFIPYLIYYLGNEYNIENDCQNNKYFNEYIQPFVKRNERFYNEMYITAEKEFTKTDEVTSQIDDYIRELENKINDVENELDILTNRCNDKK